MLLHQLSKVIVSLLVKVNWSRSLGLATSCPAAQKIFPPYNIMSLLRRLHCIILFYRGSATREQWRCTAVHILLFIACDRVSSASVTQLQCAVRPVFIGVVLCVFWILSGGVYVLFLSPAYCELDTLFSKLEIDPSRWLTGISSPEYKTAL